MLILAQGLAGDSLLPLGFCTPETTDPTQGTQGPASLVPYRHHNVQAPHHGGEVEGNQLSRFIELAVFDLGEMETPVDFLGSSRGREMEKKT